MKDLVRGESDLYGFRHGDKSAAARGAWTAGSRNTAAVIDGGASVTGEEGEVLEAGKAG